MMGWYSTTEPLYTVLKVGINSKQQVAIKLVVNIDSCGIAIIVTIWPVKAALVAYFARCLRWAHGGDMGCIASHDFA